MSLKSFLIVASVLLASGCRSGLDRQARVAERSALVMPFDLERTSHIFRKVDDGGLQQVVSDDDDPAQIHLIRVHLSEEAQRFARGDFHDPEMIHGKHMAGLHALVMGHERLIVTTPRWSAVRKFATGRAIRISSPPFTHGSTRR